MQGRTLPWIALQDVFLIFPKPWLCNCCIVPNQFEEMDTTRNQADQTPWTDIQENFLLGIAANAGSSDWGFDQPEKFLEAINAQLQSIPGWEVVWGPGIYNTIPVITPESNAMYLAYNADKASYFLGVAGTNPISLYDWILEDGAVGSTVPWPYGNAGSDAAITEGLSVGLKHLQAMVASDRVMGPGTTLLEFLTNAMAEAQQPLTMRIAGHSLGGALCPLLGLWLLDIQSQWDPRRHIQAWEIWPSAGFTPGTPDFQTYYQNRLPNTTRIHNTIDLVPHAFNVTTLAEAKTMYAPQIESDTVNDLIDSVINKAKPFNYQQIGSIDHPLEGSLRTSIIDPERSGFLNYLLQAGFQHVKAYFHLLDVTSAFTSEMADAWDTALDQSATAFFEKHQSPDAS